MATSNQYNFKNVDVDYVVRDAFERCEIPNYKITGSMAKSARMSLNYLFSEMINYGLNLFTIQTGMLPVYAGQSKYQLPTATVSKIMECNLAKAEQIVGGTAGIDPTATITAGSVQSLFLTTGTGQCTLSTPNAWISYTYDLPQQNPPQSILYVGVQTYATNTYTLAIEYAISPTPADADWVLVLQTPTTLYYAGIPIFYALPFSNRAASWRIREVAGAVLNLAQISLDIPTNIQPMTAVGRDQYFNFAINDQEGAPANYWFDRGDVPVLNVYPFSDTTYQFLVFNYTNTIQDVNSFSNSLPIVNRFLNPVCAGLAVKLAEKYVSDGDLVAKLVDSADKAFQFALGEDVEMVKMQMHVSPEYA